MSKIYIPKNSLKEKVGDDGFSQERIKSAQKIIDENIVDFEPIARNYIIKIKEALSDFEEHKNHDILYCNILDQLIQLRAQGGLFGHPSVTAITDPVVDVMDSLSQIDHTIIEIINSYKQAVLVLIASHIKSDQDKICIALVLELKKVCTKYKEYNKQHLLL